MHFNYHCKYCALCDTSTIFIVNLHFIVVNEYCNTARIQQEFVISYILLLNIVKRHEISSLLMTKMLTKLSIGYLWDFSGSSDTNRSNAF